MTEISIENEDTESKTRSPPALNASTEVCRSCARGALIPVLSLGRTPLANALLSVEQLAQPEETFPLDLVFCSGCGLVQITETVSPEKLFRQYFYLSSFSDTMLQHAEALTDQLALSRALGAQSFVIELASNDGYLLQFYRRKGIPILGIEPAKNIAQVAEERGIPTICDFFSEALATQLAAEGKKADVIHAHNVLAHVADLNGIVRGIEMLLKDTGIAVIEVPYVKDMIDRTEFDTIYHEHLCYFSLSALDRLFQRHGLIVTDVEKLAIHGGTLRIYAAKALVGKRSASVLNLLAEEAGWGVDTADFYLRFGARVERLRNELTGLLKDLKSQGKRIAVYGASAKGSTLLNYFRIGRETLEYVVDRSTVKQGYYTPGTHLRIFPTEKLLEDMPDYVLLLTWNFADEVLQQQSQYRAGGGHFVIPIPEVSIV